MKKYNIYIFVAFIIFFGAILRFDKLGERSFWFDEIVELRHADQILSDKNIISGDGTGARLVTRGYYIIVGILKLCCGKMDEFIARLPAFLFGILAIPLIYLTGRALFGYKEGIISAFLLSTSTYHIAYSQEARPYSMLAFFSLLSFYCLYSALKYRKLSWCLGFICSTFLNLYSHYAGFYVLVAEIIWILIWPFKDFKLYKKYFKNKLFILLALIITVLITPIASKGIKLIVNKKLLFKQIDGLSFSTSFFYRIFGDFSCLSDPFIYRKIIFTVFSVFVVWGIIKSIKQYRLETFGIVTLVLAPFIMVFTVFKPYNFFNPRYFIFILPIFLIGVARGMVSISEDINKYLKLNLNIVLSIFVLMTGVLHIRPLLEFHYSEKDNWKAAAHIINKEYKQGDKILLDRHESITSLSYYLLDKIEKDVPIVLGYKGISKDAGLIWYIPYAGDSFIGEEGYESFRNSVCALNVEQLSNAVTLYKLKYLDKYNPGDAGPIRFEAENAPSFIGRKVRDGQAENKYAKCAAVFWDGKKDNLLVYGPFFEPPKGEYIVKFKIKITDNNISDPCVKIDINNPEKKEPLIAEKNICGMEFNKPNKYEDFYLPFSHDGEGKLEFRVHYLGKTDLWVDYTEIASK